MEEHWVENGPPAYISLAAHLGLIKASGNGTSGGGLRADSPENEAALMALFGEFEATGGIIGG